MNGTAAQDSIRIVRFDDRHAEAFARLNAAWLHAYGLYEDGDRKHLEHPRTVILDTGGEIFVALNGETVVGTCAVVRRDTQTFELAKLAVAPQARGGGLGRLLSETAIEWARRRGARRVVLLSSTKLGDALRLYERMGFRYLPLPEDPVYETADVYMELPLEPLRPEAEP